MMDMLPSYFLKNAEFQLDLFVKTWYAMFKIKYPHMEALRMYRKVLKELISLPDFVRFKYIQAAIPFMSGIKRNETSVATPTVM